MRSQKCVEPGCNKKVHRTGTNRCKSHLKAYRREYYMNNKEKFRTSLDRHYDPAVIERELKGECKIPGGLFQTYSKEQIRLLQIGNVELFRKFG